MPFTQNTEITVSLDKETTELLIVLAGGKRHARGGYMIDGAHYWQTDEALWIALRNIAESNGISL